MDPQAQGFEVTEYGDAGRPDRVFSVIAEIIQNQVDRDPAVNMRVHFVGDMCRLSYHSYEMHAPRRMNEIEGRAKDGLNEAAKLIKKEFKSRTGKVLKFAEKKDMANYDVQKASLNERYMVSYWRFYGLS
jgi:hypothetical protein